MEARREIRARSDVARYRNPSVIKRFRETYDFDVREAEQLFRDMLDLLWLGATLDAEGHGREAPVLAFLAAVDEMWHTFILDTAAYAAFCARYLGGFMHHAPNFRYQKPLGPRQLVAHRKKLDAYVEDVFRLLGEETAVRWFDTYPDRYGDDAGEFLERRRVKRSVAKASPPPKRGRRRATARAR